MRRASHVGGDVIQPTIVVNIRKIRTHGIPRRVRNRIGYDIGKRHLTLVINAIVSIQEIGTFVVVGHV